MKRGVAVFVIAAAVILLGLVYIIFYPSRASLERQIRILQAENETLRRSLIDIKNSPIVAASPKGFRGIEAPLFSVYPFSDRSRLTINAGSAQGIKKGMPAVVWGDVLLGEIEKVYERYSVIRTIFDEEWSSPIRIGPNRVEALLVGGPQPRIQFIEKDADVKEGYTVYSASSLFPYGLVLGTLTDIRADAALAFKEGVLLPQQKIREVRSVFVVTDFRK